MNEFDSKAEIFQECTKNNKNNKDRSKYYLAVVNNPNWFTLTSNGRKFRPLLFSKYFLTKNHVYSLDNSFLVYENGFYREYCEYEFNSMVSSELSNYNSKDNLDYSTSWRKEAVAKIKEDTYISHEYFTSNFNKDWKKINVKNGIIQIYKEDNKFKFKFMKHDYKFLSTIQLNVEYNENELNTEYYNNFLNTSLNTEIERNYYNQVMGYRLINKVFDNHGQSIFFFDGEGGNGKGTGERLYAEIVGSSNVNDEKCKNLFDDSNQNQFYGFGYLNKLSIVISECSGVLKSLEYAKNLSGKDKVKFQVKGLMIEKKFLFGGKVILLTNHDTMILDKSKGIKRRAKFVQMNNKIVKEVNELDTKLEKEKNGIFKIWLNSLLDFMNNDYYFILPESHYSCYNRHFEYSDNFLSFVRKHIIQIDGFGITRKQYMNHLNDLYGNMYKNRDECIKNFDKTLKDEGIKCIYKSGRFKYYDDNNNICYGNQEHYDGITFVEDKQVLDTNEYIPKKEDYQNINIEILKIHLKLIKERIAYLSNSDIKEKEYLEIEENGKQIDNKFVGGNKQLDIKNITEFKKEKEKKEKAQIN